eukprot:199211_1
MASHNRHKTMKSSHSRSSTSSTSSYSASQNNTLTVRIDKLEQKTIKQQKQITNETGMRLDAKRKQYQIGKKYDQQKRSTLKGKPRVISDPIKDKHNYEEKQQSNDHTDAPDDILNEMKEEEVDEMLAVITAHDEVDHEKRSHNRINNVNHDTIFNKWIKIFELQIKHNVPFDHTTFAEIVNTYKNNTG